MDQQAEYEVIIALPAKRRYQDQILNYLLKYFSIKRVDQIDSLIWKEVGTLKNAPNRGAKEVLLSEVGREFKYLLFKESRVFELKIIYYIDKNGRRVVVTDFFPTKMNPQNVSLFNSP